MTRFFVFAIRFFFYSVLGWCTEVTLKYIHLHRFINRGFYTGPVLPIYGCAASLVGFAVSGLFPRGSSHAATFAVSFLVCGIVEYLVSYIGEKRYHARWWDYSQRPLNLNGRIWIGNLILFGLGGVAIIHFIDPFLFGVLGAMSDTAVTVTAVSLLALFAVDFFISHVFIRLVRIGGGAPDNTEAIGSEIRLLLSDRALLRERLAEAYPRMFRIRRQQ